MNYSTLHKSSSCISFVQNTQFLSLFDKQRRNVLNLQKIVNLA